jgi:Zn-dependent protease
MPTRRGSIRIFRFLGIDVYLHWSWILVFVFIAQSLQFHEYRWPGWYVLECLSLFAIVLMHEFGHALACRQVGGQASQIILWPLGGVAYVAPPQRPGAMLWSIAAGPLVNVALVPVFSVFWLCSYLLGWPQSHPDVNHFLQSIWGINLGLFIFNMLPFFPLDGGQILRSLLWFLFGRANSLLIASIVGFVGVVGATLLIALMYSQGHMGYAGWYAVLDAFVAMNCWAGLRQALALGRLEKAPRRPEFSCPVCHTSPPVGEYWGCSRCRRLFDTFLTQGICPHCNTQYTVTACPFCHSARPMAEWSGTPAAQPNP